MDSDPRHCRHFSKYQPGWSFTLYVAIHVFEHSSLHISFTQLKMVTVTDFLGSNMYMVTWSCLLQQLKRKVVSCQVWSLMKEDLLFVFVSCQLLSTKHLLLAPAHPLSLLPPHGVGSTINQSEVYS